MTNLQTNTPLALTQSKQKFNGRVKQWLRDVPQSSGVDNETKAVALEESEIGDKTKTVPYDDIQATAVMLILKMIFVKTFTITRQL